MSWPAFKVIGRPCASLRYVVNTSASVSVRVKATPALSFLQPQVTACWAWLRLLSHPQETWLSYLECKAQTLDRAPHRPPRPPPTPAPVHFCLLLHPEFIFMVKLCPSGRTAFVSLF